MNSNQLTSKTVRVEYDPQNGTIGAIVFAYDPDGMNWLIDNALLEGHGFPEAINCLLGKSSLAWNGMEWDTRGEHPSQVDVDTEGVRFFYTRAGLELTHSFYMAEGGLYWRIMLCNRSTETIQIDAMYHWLPVRYVMYQTIAGNLHMSCSMTPSVSGDCSYMVCRKRSGDGPDLLVLNDGGRQRSVGSWCHYHNYFFEKSAPSLSGLVLFNTVHCIPSRQDPLIDWQYRDAYEPVTLEPGQCFEDAYRFVSAPKGEPAAGLLEHGYPVFDFQPVVMRRQKITIHIRSANAPLDIRLLYADVKGVHEANQAKVVLQECGQWRIEFPSVDVCGEYEVRCVFAGGRRASVFFAVYESMAEMVDAFCQTTYEQRFIDDPFDAHYCGYRSISRQGEACAKGALLVMRSLLNKPDRDQIAQAERNAVHYLRSRWLDKEFRAIKQYPGGFARIFDLDYLILEFYLLGLCKDEWLSLNRADVYLVWAWKTARYRFARTSDKLPREVHEAEMPCTFPFILLDMPRELRERNFVVEAAELEALLQDNVSHTRRKGLNQAYIETEHYFDNAGIAVFAENMFRTGHLEEAQLAAELLLANVSPSTDYRNFAPDRWWEALAPMYHNLWAVFSAKALVTAYDYTGNNAYLLAGYRAMMPMFYNYDWRALSSPNRFEKGGGVSAYCLTNPNLNTAQASRNRFGQSIFQGDFFDQLEITGDDWDLGADLIAYLSTFGQTAYVIEEAGAWIGVNARLELRGGDTTITSNAAYPREYRIAPLRLVVRCTTPGALIHGLTIKQGHCAAVNVQADQDTPLSLSVMQDGQPVLTYPQVRYVGGD